MNKTTKEIYELSLNILSNKDSHSFEKSFKKDKSSRCIEVPWVASWLQKYHNIKILDIGFSLASIDYLGILLKSREIKKVELDAIDIVDPKKLKNRYPEKWHNEIYSIPITIGDIRKTDLPKEKYDFVTCISVIEHIGYDKASKFGKSVFTRTKNLSEINTLREAETDTLVLKKIHHSLKKNGKLLISVPIGAGGPVILQDSLGFYCVQWEYETNSWDKILNFKGFDIIEEKYFKLDSNLNWKQVKNSKDLNKCNHTHLSHSNGCAIALLNKN